MLPNFNLWTCSVQFFHIKPFLKHSSYVCFTSAIPPFQSLLFLTYILIEPTVLLYCHRKHTTVFLICIFFAPHLRWPLGPLSLLQSCSTLQRVEKVPLTFIHRLPCPPKYICSHNKLWSYRWDQKLLSHISESKAVNVIPSTDTMPLF